MMGGRTICAGCGEVVNPGEKYVHNKWAYHKGCLDKYLSKQIEAQQQVIDQLDLDLGELRPDDEPDIYDAVAEYRAAHPERPDDGSDGQHYDLIIMSDHDGPQRVRCVEVIEALGLDHGMGEVLCSIWRMGKKPGEERARAIRKAIYYLQRALDKEARS